MKRSIRVASFLFCALAYLFPASALAQTAPEIYSYTAAKPFCDVAYQNCRVQIVNFIDAEPAGGSIDVAFWFMEDDRYATALINAWNDGVRVRVMIDTDALVGSDSDIATRRRIIDRLKTAGIPIRHKSTGGILHWKTMIFGVQNVVNFSAGNFSPDGYVSWDQYVNYEDEVVAFTKDEALVATFKSKYDDVWTSTNGYADYANVTVLERYHQTVTQDPRMNFPPTQNYATRAVSEYNRETVGIDVTMYRITDRRHSDAMIAAMQRGVAVRLYTEQLQYRDESRLWHSWNVDRMYMAGRDASFNCIVPNGNCITIRHRQHNGLNHQKSVILHGRHMVIFGSSNWTSPSASSQLEHNIFTTENLYYDFFVSQFNRKWNNTAPSPETKPFVPLPPDKPVILLPANGATGQNASGVVLKWNGGPWAHLYDIYVGTAPTMTPENLIAADLELAPDDNPDYTHTITTPPLQPGTTYFVKIVSKTMAYQTATHSTQWSFTTAGTPGPGPGQLPSGWSTADIGAVGAAGSATYNSTGELFTVAGSGADIWGTADEFRFAYTTMNGDGAITARVASLTNENAWTKAGVMMRNGVTASAAHATMFVSSAKGLAFQRRPSAGGTSLSTAGQFAGDPYWVRLSRVGNTFTAEVSPDGTSWTTVGTETIPMNSTIQVGLAVTSHLDGVVSTATFDNVTFGSSEPQEPTLPDGWSSSGVGTVSPNGSATFDATTNTYTVKGAGADVWGSADAFHYAYKTLNGDGEIVARVDSVTNVDVWTKVGVMIRDGLSPGAAHASMFVTPTTLKGTAFQRRPTPGGTTLSTAGPAVAPPYWLKVTRVGNSLSAFTSADGLSWTQVGPTQTIAMGTVVHAGLAVSSHRNGTLATARFSSVTVTD